MRKSLILTAVCLILGFTLSVTAQQRRHPDIMNDLSATRDALDGSREAGEMGTVETRARGLARLILEVVPTYERLNLAPAATLANEASAAWTEVATAAAANDAGAVETAYTAARATCGGCHMQYRERDADGNFRINRGQ